ncbi:antibiotic biosynthesis monooxygenase [Actinoplanes oblitus]|uniref:Antibiotic biosynthesis monooxygenase n=1 Tax=Actinoplanes oblitus TaxID=3040509 RepID=A0ABY8W949_9ACTN|nr:antibiotic biosynthesis monooxygenase [Actinoplanes oblitus]WIM92968.1 antibiotic biosynthesis monooxygenase [Actinoplanes oblitus]
MSEAFGLVVRFTLRDPRAAAGFDALTELTLRGITSTEPGTLTYLVHTVPDEPLVRIFYELYADREAFDVHERQPHTRHFLAEREQYLAGVEVTWLRGGTGKPATR